MVDLPKMTQEKPVLVSCQRDKAPIEPDQEDDKHLDVPEEPDYVLITPSDLAEKAKEINRNLQDTHQYKTQVVKKIFLNRAPSIPTGLGRRLGNLRTSFSLVTVINHIADNQFPQAKKQAKRALELAQASNDKLSVARCHYWMGRIEFEKQNMQAAHAHFLAARPCIMDNINPEGETLRFYLDASRKGISGEYMKRILTQYNLALVQSAPRERPFRRSNPPTPKRKWENQPWKAVLRPALTDKTGKRQKRSPGLNTSKRLGRLNKWIVRDVPDLPDLPFRPKDSSGTTKPDQGSTNHHELPGDPGTTENQADFVRVEGKAHGMGASEEGMEWLQAANSGPRLEQRGEFTLRCYPVGLSPRTRSTEIFSRIPDEILLSAQEWKSLSKLMSNRAITMAYLAKERQLRLSNMEEIAPTSGVEGK
ncbi:uncharacterized protein N7473_004923 [Penicillium subrubescens]|uniref:Uncharacterized protein n=1 Tax=Penicillium subrubescens TaxID=1316194 RepID=A0A1Q5T9J9_9EURO|nr:uncharacterized protein N7473_004923 [Penicillium subrubescens]KAJ5900853.1 hypothetical protein N7473_004923 [Penicillium subrubescens]OKO96924.1 hypothetical protein PENSUB_10478 [Penicillium subrubescens]